MQIDKQQFLAQWDQAQALLANDAVVRHRHWAKRTLAQARECISDGTTIDSVERLFDRVCGWADDPGYVYPAALVARQMVGQGAAATKLDGLEVGGRETRVFLGDVEVAGDVFNQGWIVVLGNLTVAGRHYDTEEPASMLVVLGNFNARNVMTEGWLVVGGDMVTEAYYGNYNDRSTLVGGRIKTPLMLRDGDHDVWASSNEARHQFMLLGLSADEPEAKQLQDVLVEGLAGVDDSGCVYVDVDTLMERAQNGEPVLR